MTSRLDAKRIAAEVAVDNFPDARLTKRLETIMLAVGKDPSASLPKALTSAELEGAYRFFSNPRVTLDSILSPHFEATKARVAAEARVRVIHDATEFSYRADGERQGLGNRAYQGFSGHFSLVVTADESRKPLGLAGLHTWVRDGSQKETEQSYWLKQIRRTEQMLDCGTKAIHICDRGAEDFALFGALLADDHRFVARVGNRFAELGDAPLRLRDVLATVEHVDERKAKINRRSRHSSEKLRKIHPPRDARMIQLHLAAATIALPRPAVNAKTRSRLEHLPQALTINAVRVWEPSPPDGADPVEWFLFTNEPIATPEDVRAIVDHYRARWRIEEYFKALKTGCAFERRQLHDYDSLLNALGVFAPLAYHILLLRSEARAKPDAPASTVATNDQLQVLRGLGRRKLPEHPTARDVLLAIAALGGHIAYAPDPGWLTIARGYEQLDAFVLGWQLAKLQSDSDQR